MPGDGIPIHCWWLLFKCDKFYKYFQERFTEIAEKFERFRSPSNLEPRLGRAMRELRGIEEATCLLELASEDPEGIQGQLTHCKVSGDQCWRLPATISSVLSVLAEQAYKSHTGNMYSHLNLLWLACKVFFFFVFGTSILSRSVASATINW